MGAVRGRQGCDEQPVTHKVLDELPPGKVLAHLGYMVWHPMRQLRCRLSDDHGTRLQDLNVRCNVTAANNFLG